MAEETDGVGETFDDSLRIALTIASQFGERIARLREQLARQREASASQEARERFAVSLEGKADQKTINARILADGENAKHPREAVMSQSGKAAKPRRSSKSGVQQRDRGGLSR